MQIDYMWALSCGTAMPLVILRYATSRPGGSEG